MEKGPLEQGEQSTEKRGESSCTTNSHRSDLGFRKLRTDKKTDNGVLVTKDGRFCDVCVTIWKTLDLRPNVEEERMVPYWTEQEQRRAAEERRRNQR